MPSISPVNLVFAVLFAVFGFFMLIFGGSLLLAGPSNSTEWTMCSLALLSAAFLILGAWQTVQNGRKQVDAEVQETIRLKQKFTAQNQSEPTENITIKPAQAAPVGEVAEPENQPEVLVRWTYPATEWRPVMKKLAQKTWKEEIYTAIWFPIFGGIIFWQSAVWGILGGLFCGFLYLKFRVYFVAKKFGLHPRAAEAEVIISDSYLYVNGNFMHYADGHYYLRDLTLDNDPKLGDYLLFTIGWTTSKGYPAQMDVHVPVPPNCGQDAERILTKFKQARS